jgi:Protein of unknown function (DUF2891)
VVSRARDVTDARLAANAPAYADVALANVRREFPNLLHHVMAGPDDRPRPRDAHPAFYGSFDWHSCVEMFWVLARLARLVPGVGAHPGLRETLAEHLTHERLAAEAEFFAAERHRTVERPYGWGWALALAAELEDGPYAAAFAPLADVLVERFVEWLPKQAHPVRAGVHGNSAFGLVLALPYARTSRPELAAAIETAARYWFAEDADYPARWEPSGTDFLSPALCEAVLMQEVLSGEFDAWLAAFLPTAAAAFEPVALADPSDGQLAHLHGLNLSRAWALRRLGFEQAAEQHAAAALPHVVGSDYMVEHWLAAYAVLYLTA